jgi:MFS family permease
MSRWIRVSRNVVFLGLTSMFTDISSEMVVAILPLYLTFELRFTPLQFGIFDGFYQGITALLRLASGLAADRQQRYKGLAGAGYALSTGCKLGLLAVGSAWIPTMACLFLDRLGKGIRTAPRDALISLSSPQACLAEAFGIHRAFDTAGALLGPIVAFSLLSLVPGGYDIVFATSFFAGVIGLGTLMLFVDNRERASGLDTSHPHVSLQAAVALVGVPCFRALVIAGALLSLASVSDALIYLTFQRRSDLNLSIFPLLYVGTAFVYLLLAVPAGRLADRVGRGRVLLGGHVLLMAVYGILLLPGLGRIEMVCCLLLFGAYYAATDGVLIALASTALPPWLRTSGLALLTTVTATARFFSALFYGALWTCGGARLTLSLFIVGLTGAIVFAAVTLASEREPAEA